MATREWPQRAVEEPQRLRLSSLEKAAAEFRLPQLEQDALIELRKINSRPGNKALEIGIGRPSADRPALHARAAWQRVEGGVATRWTVASDSARALRVGIDGAHLPPGVELRFASAIEPDVVYGPFTARDIVAGETYWSPVLHGDVAWIEAFAPTREAAREFRGTLWGVSHLVVRMTDSLQEIMKVGNLGDSGSCNVDLVCRSASDAQLAAVGRAVARMTVTKTVGSTSFCTGTLLAQVNFIPYFYSANHCMSPTVGGTSTQQVANTLTTHWFFDRTGCGSGGVSSAYVQVTGGAALLHANATTDVLFVQLNSLPPNGSASAGWDAAALPAGTAVVGVHHPSGDVKKVSLGSMRGFDAWPNPGTGTTHLDITWNSTATGITEGGSSGSGIFSGSSSQGYFLRGGLYGGPSSCSATGSNLRDYYSRLDQSYGLIRKYLVPSYTALWWNPAESGWGLNLTHQGDIVFGTLFTYDTNGTGMWLVMTGGTLRTDGTYVGALYRTTGPAFNANPFTPITAANLTQVGNMAIGFTSTNAAVLAYSVNGVTVTKLIQRQVYGSRAASCEPGSGSRASATNYQDLWWNANESGWGVNITHQDNTLFATLFTYDSSGRGMWLVMDGGTRQADGSYLGNLYRTTGPAFNANPFTPLTAANVTQVGTMRFTFSNGENATMTYSVNGVNVTKQITRQVFGNTVPVCS